MPGARRIRARSDGGPLRGGAPRAVWLTLGTAPRSVSVQSAAARLIGEGRPCHLIWDPVTGEVAQLVSILRAARALGEAEQLVPAHGAAGGGARSAPASVRGAGTTNVNTEGRVCVQIGVLGHGADPFTSGPVNGVTALMSWLDSWGVARHWPAGQPASPPVPAASGARALWALGGHFGACQVPGGGRQGPGSIDTSLLTGPHVLPAYHGDRIYLSPALPIPA
jgi:hypothetical protein